MTEPWQAGLRVLRATTVAAVTVTLALMAHLLAGGERPTAATLLQATLLLAVVMGLVAGRRRGITPVLIGIGITQLALHQWFSLATPGECAGHVAARYVPGAHVLPESMLPWGLLAQTARACATTGDTGATVIALAVAGHALAALLVGVLITRGETALACLVGLVLRHLPQPAVLPRLPGGPTTGTAPTLAASPLLRHVQRRGPPVARVA